MTYMAPWVTLVVAVNHCLCFVQLNGERARWRPLPWFVHAYWLQYLCLGALTAKQVHDMVFNIMMPTQWLDPKLTNAYVQCQMINEHECYSDATFANTTCDCDPLNDGACSVGRSCTHDTFGLWYHETDLAGSVLFDCIRYFSLTTPLWLIGTFAVCAYHTYGHSTRMREGGLQNNPTRRMIIAVILLPLVWALMSFSSVIRSWQILTDHVIINGGCHGRSTIFYGYEERKVFLVEMYNVNFNVAGIYQAVSLFIFAEIITAVVFLQSREIKLRQEEKDEAAEDMEAYVRKMKTSGFMEETDAFKTIAKMTMEGVLLFAFQSIAKGLFTLFITTMAFDFCGVGDHFFSFSASDPGIFQRPRIKAEYLALFKGVSLVASYNAMRHISTLQNKKGLMPEHVNANMKCNMIKILTSLESVQPFFFMLLWEVAHQTFGTRRLGDQRRDLFVASLMCMEAFFIAIANLHAWSVQETWIDDFPEPINEEMLCKMNDPFSQLDKKMKQKWFALVGRKSKTETYHATPLLKGLNHKVTLRVSDDE